MTGPTGDPSLTQDPELVTNSHDPSLHGEEEESTLIISTEALASTPERRQADDDPSNSLVTQIVQTISLIQYVNADGTPRETSTHYALPQTVLIDPVSGDIVGPVENDPPETPEVSQAPVAPEQPAPTGAVEAPAPPVSAEVPEIPEPPAATDVPDAPAPPVSADIPEVPEPPATTNPPAPTDLPSSVDSPPPALSDLPDLVPSIDIIPDLTGLLPSPSAPLDSSPAFPTLLSSGFQNGPYSNGTSTIQKAEVSSATRPSSMISATRTRSNLVSTTGESTYGGGGTGGGGGGSGGAGGPEVDSAISGGDDEATPTGTVVGSVVGSVAGAALLVFLVMALLRWRKRQSGRLRLGDDPSGSSRLVTDGHDGGSGGGMVQPFAVPAVLANMSYKNRSSPGGSQSGEKGFYRVSGKKLPPVIRYGGDGFSDPRQSTVSGASSTYPDSQNFDVEQGAASRFALGQPMRPVSGVPVIRSSPARTPVTAQNPFSDPPPPSDPFEDPRRAPPTPPQHLDPDAIGRSLTSQDMSRGSSSRFTEVL